MLSKLNIQNLKSKHSNMTQQISKVVKIQAKLKKLIVQTITEWKLTIFD
jgi:transcription termination factor NusB